MEGFNSKEVDDVIIFIAGVYTIKMFGAMHFIYQINIIITTKVNSTYLD